MATNPEFQGPFAVESDRPQTRYDAFKQILKLRQELNFNYENFKDLSSILTFLNTCTSFDLGLSTKLGVHITLYAKTVMALGSAKHFRYVKAAYDFNDIGCFALTEMRHGSNTRNIQTRADFDPKTREFVINTPENADMKVWIGAAGQLANISVVWA
mmetsp:Transcript_39476/g.35242  ORF Transcript_39476/g.35242 Transcript_39476/m.35242 type:complete len:157 (+) Transcript_39476:202-672(+)